MFEIELCNVDEAIFGCRGLTKAGLVHNFTISIPPEDCPLDDDHKIFEVRVRDAVLAELDFEPFKVEVGELQSDDEGLFVLVEAYS